MTSRVCAIVAISQVLDNPIPSRPRGVGGEYRPLRVPLDAWYQVRSNRRAESVIALGTEIDGAIIEICPGPRPNSGEKSSDIETASTSVLIDPKDPYRFIPAAPLYPCSF